MFLSKIKTKNKNLYKQTMQYALHYTWRALRKAALREKGRTRREFEGAYAFR